MVLLRAAATALLLALLCSSPALAADRDRDGMPDRWERRHKVKKPRGDSDRDGLRNLMEYRARTNPRRRDTDRDGLRDGDEIRFGWHPRRRDTDRDGIRDGGENAGVVTAVDGQQVTIKLARGGRLSGLLDDPSALTCVTAPEVLAPAPSKDSPDEAPGDSGDSSAPEDEFWDPAWGDQPGDLDGDVDEDVDEGTVLARAAQAPEDEDLVGEEASTPEPDDPESDSGDAPDGEVCRATLRVGALVHEATSEALPGGGRRLARLSLVV